MKTEWSEPKLQAGGRVVGRGVEAHSARPTPSFELLATSTERPNSSAAQKPRNQHPPDDHFRQDRQSSFFSSAHADVNLRGSPSVLRRQTANEFRRLQSAMEDSPHANSLVSALMVAKTSLNVPISVQVQSSEQYLERAKNRSVQADEKSFQSQCQKVGVSERRGIYRVAIGPVWWDRRGFTRQPESPNVHISGFGPSKTPTKFNARTPRERKKNENCGGRSEKKERNFGRSGGGLSGGGLSRGGLSGGGLSGGGLSGGGLSSGGGVHRRRVQRKGPSEMGCRVLGFGFSSGFWGRKQNRTKTK